jgi:hypothetical protein
MTRCSILRFLDAGLQRVLYIDLDAHHGDEFRQPSAAVSRWPDPQRRTLARHQAIKIG